MKLKHLEELDGIRAIAALMVMFFHFFAQVQVDGVFMKFVQKISVVGQTGVSLFFVLSGFLITRILINTKQTPGFFINFYVRRALRIFPLYYFFLILFFFVLPFIESTPLVPFNEQIYFWIYLQNIAVTFGWDINGPRHYWSLAVEEHFYLFWPILVYYLNKKQIKIAVLAIIICAIITRVILINYDLSTFYFTLSRIDELALGALLAIYELNGKLISKNRTKFLVLIPIVLLAIFFQKIFESETMVYLKGINFTLVSLLYMSLIGWLITSGDNNYIKKMLKSKWLAFTGKISYGLYVYHPLCFILIKKYFYLGNVYLYFLISFLVVFIVAHLSYCFFESKFLYFKKYFDYKMVKGS